MSVESRATSDIQSIREELLRARREAGDNERGTMTATTMNFVVYIDRPEYRDWILERAEKIAEKHPARLLILDANADRSGASLATSLRQGTTTVRTERVDIGVGDLTAEQTYAVANSLSIPDLRTVLWWTGVRIAGEQRFEELLELADDVVVDSSGALKDETSVRELVGFLSRHRTVALQDLAYMRLAPWQDMIAQFFDDTQLREELFSIKHVTVASGSDAEGLYLGGWLGSRLGWVACHRAMFCDRGGIEIPFSLTRSGEIRRVTSVRLETQKSVYTAELAQDDGRVVALRIEGARARPDRIVPLQSVDNASLIERAILERSTNEIFETSLRMVGRLLA